MLESRIIRLNRFESVELHSNDPNQRRAKRIRLDLTGYAYWRSSAFAYTNPLSLLPTVITKMTISSSFTS